MEVKRNYLLNRFFSRSTIRNLLKNNQDLIFNEILELAPYEYSSNLETIQNCYIQLDKSYRNEYFYKNTLLNKLLLGVHSINTTSALTEIPLGSAKPDFVLINGKAVVYEIKTELDNFERIENQIREYYKAFDHVSIVTHEKNIDIAKTKIANLNKPIGLYILQKNNKIKTILKPQEYKNDLEIEVIFKILRKNEYENIILKYFKELPKVSQFEYYDECEKIIKLIPLELLYKDFLVELKKRSQINKTEFEKVPKELRFLVYFMDFKPKDYHLLNDFLYKK